MPDEQINVFISYSHSDNEFVDRLEADVRQGGYDTWMDRRGLAGGQKWRRELQEALDRSHVVLVVLSPEAASSEYVQSEYGYATDEGKLVIPLYYRPCKVPMELRGIQWIDFQHSYEQGLQALLLALGAAGGPSRPPASSAPSTASQAKSQVAVEAPWNVPFARNPFFLGRDALIEQVHEQFHRAQPATPNHALALCGLGGIGKTQIAIEYAHRYRQEYRAVFWVNADSRETLVADFIALARLLDLPGQDEQDQMRIVAVVKRWLEQHEGWLLIFNNADELALLTTFLPSKKYILLTTRSQATGRIAQSLSVEKLELSEGMRLLLRRAKLLAHGEPLESASASLREEAQALSSELDGLPVAIDQAGAYIEETGCSLSEYLGLYRRRRLVLLKRQSSMGSDYPHTVASTWALSFQQVEQADPAAADLLRLCAFLHPDAIPEALLTEGADQLGPLLQEVAADPLLLNEAFQLLRRYSLVKRDPQAKLLYLHRLVQVVLKESLDADTQRQWAERTVRAVNAIFPHEDFPSWERCELLLPHAQRCAELIAHYGLSFPEAARLLHATGLYLHNRGQYAQAEPLLQQGLVLRQHTLGAEHPDTISTLNALAELYTVSGNYQQAERLIGPALVTEERALGPEHLEMANALNTLAGIYLFTGRYMQAEPLYWRALAIREHTLGPSHPFVADILNNLGLLYYNQGKYPQAEPLYQRVLSGSEQALGPEHPDTLITLANLARLYYEQGKYRQAEPLLQQALTVRERVLGAEHPDTLHSLHLLGRLSTLQGHYQQAASLLQRAHALLERVLGAENDQTLGALLALAQLTQVQHQDAQAETLYQQALSGFERVLGPKHPRVAETLIGLAQLSTRQGDYTQAEPLLQRALAICEHVLGPEHPTTATALDAQGHLALLQGREEQAASLLQRALSIREQALGADHPDVAQTLQHLAELSQKQGKPEQAETLYSRALAIREQVLGADHPDTIATREALDRLLVNDLKGRSSHGMRNELKVSEQ